MTVAALQLAPRISSLPNRSLATILDQSLDCVKLVGLDGALEYMNHGGQCAMEIDDVSAVIGRQWIDLWPAETREAIANACDGARAGIASQFTAFCPTAKGTARWWSVSVSPVRDEGGAVSEIISISRDVTEAELSRQALESSTAEMRHRLKNTYAMIGSLLSSFARGNPDREAFAGEMIDRLAALGQAQTLFASNEQVPCRLHELIPAVVSGFSGADCAVDIAAIGQVEVDQGQADAIALVLGELAVNSMKHGALGSVGHVAISATDSEGRVCVGWSERSRRTVTARARDGGQGLRLMDRIVKARRGSLDFAWQDNGVDVSLCFARG